MVQTSGFRQKFYTTFSGNFSMYLFTPDKKYIQLKFDIVTWHLPDTCILSRARSSTS